MVPAMASPTAFMFSSSTISMTSFTSRVSPNWAACLMKMVASWPGITM